MTQKRSTGTVVGLIVGLLFMMGGCGGESSQTGGTGQVILEQPATAFAATKLPGQEATTLDIVGTPLTGIRATTVNSDGSVVFENLQVPVGTWVFRITYRAGSGSVQYVIAEASVVATVAANTTTYVKLPTPTKLSAPATAIAVGSDHSCALLADATVSCWGGNQVGQLGNGTTEESSSPVEVIGLSAPATAVGAGGASGGYSCAVLNGGTAGTVWCWGANTTAQQVTNLPIGATDVAVGSSFGTDAPASCALLTTGAVWCWGAKSAPKQVTLSSGATDVAGGASRSCAVLDDKDKTVWCWDWTANNTPEQITLSTGKPLTGATDVAVGGFATSGAISRHSCAVLNGGTAGTVWCWEANTAAQQVTNLPIGATDVADGSEHSCARLTTGTVWCWGANSSGQLGDGSFIASTSPVAVTELSAPATAVAAGGTSGSAQSCALLTGGTMSCWGANSSGELGNGSIIASTSPVAVTGLSAPATNVTAGGFHSCAVLDDTDKTVWCWGDNRSGQLGDGTKTNSSTPVRVTNLPIGATAVAAGGSHSCAVLNGGTAGTVWCWGTNTAAQLVTNLPIGATDVAAGGSHSCAVLNRGATTGTVWCWRANTAAQQVTNLPIGATAVAAGGSDSCAVLKGGATTGTVWCWRANTAAQLVTNLPIGATAIAVGSFHSCAVTGAVWCWGGNSSGQLGNGSDTSPPTLTTPVEVFNLTTASRVAAGHLHSCAVLLSRTVRCWGNNSSGQLGDGTKDQSSIPVPVSNLTTATAVTAGNNHSCARLTVGTVSCWGVNSFGQLGNGALLVSPLPVKVVGIP